MGFKNIFVEKYGTQQDLLDYNNLNYLDLSKKMKNLIKK